VALGDNGDLDVVGQPHDAFHQAAAEGQGPFVLLRPGNEDLCDFVGASEFDARRAISSGDEFDVEAPERHPTPA